MQKFQTVLKIECIHAIRIDIKVFSSIRQIILQNLFWVAERSLIIVR